MTIEGTMIIDPSLKECLALAERTRLLSMQVASMLEQSASGEITEEQSIEQSRAGKKLNGLMAQLKVLHRRAILSARDAKETTSEARREVDRLQLQLQNLYYEQRHLRGEIAACRDFPHKYTSLPLIDEEEFLASHSEHQNDDPHNLMIARLNNEKAVREDLERQRKELLAKKQTLIAENKKRKDDLASLDEQLERFSHFFQLPNFPDILTPFLSPRVPSKQPSKRFFKACIIFLCNGIANMNLEEMSFSPTRRFLV